MSIIKYNSIDDIRKMLQYKYASNDFVIDKTGCKTVEIINQPFIASQNSIFGEVNDDWNNRELEWYKSMSLNVNDIPPPIPKIWKQVSSKGNDGTAGEINSNYGWCVWSESNGHQYENVVKTLNNNPDSRQGQMIYTRPSMHTDCNRDGMSDFMCCSNTIHLIRNGKLVTCVYFRSNDAIFGYKGDYAFMKYIHDNLANDLNVKSGNIIWTAASLHVYERHFEFLK